MVYFSGIHGDEKESVILAKALMQALEKPEYTHLSNYAICPLLNPDGFLTNQRQNHNQVDLNRNFPTQNWELNEQGEHYYSGPTPGSEPETRFLIDLIETHSPKHIISIHTPYRIINYDGPALRLAEKLAEFNHYPVEASIGYPTPGSFGTYTGIERNIPVLTLELPEMIALILVSLITTSKALLSLSNLRKVKPTFKMSLFRFIWQLPKLYL